MIGFLWVVADAVCVGGAGGYGSLSAGKLIYKIQLTLSRDKDHLDTVDIVQRQTFVSRTRTGSTSVRKYVGMCDVSHNCKRLVAMGWFGKTSIWTPYRRFTLIK